MKPTDPVAAPLLPCLNKRASIQLSSKDIARFNSLVRSGHLSDCWEWSGHIGSKGYGSLKICGLKFFAHRVAMWMQLGRQVDSSLAVCHKCDNRKCCNPSHLFLGTLADNNLDCERKGRNPHPKKRQITTAVTTGNLSRRGERHHSVKLSSATVLSIRAAYAPGATSELADKFNVHRNTVLKIVNRETWTHI